MRAGRGRGRRGRGVRRGPWRQGPLNSPCHLPIMRVRMLVDFADSHCCARPRRVRRALDCRCAADHKCHRAAAGARTVPDPRCPKRTRDRLLDRERRPEQAVREPATSRFQLFGPRHARMWVNASVQRGAIGVAFRKVSRKIAAVVQKTALTRRLRDCLFLVRSGVRMLKANDGANTPAAPSLRMCSARSPRLHARGRHDRLGAHGSTDFSGARRDSRSARETGALETTLSTLAGFYVEHVVAAVKASPLLLNRA